MKTYEELLEVGENEIAKGEFCRQAVTSFSLSEDYKNAIEAEKYYNKRNATIETYQKWLYTVSGRRIEDIYSANYKLKTLFFRRMVIQLTQYLLANGVKLKDKNNKDKLGKDFDFQVQKLAKLAMVGGRSFGYWNNDHLEVFGYACTDKHAGFCPLYSEDNAELMAGIRFRFKRVGDDVITRYTLFEPEGITEYIKRGSNDVELLESRHGYKTVIVTNKAEGVLDAFDEDYNGRLPIVPMYANDLYESELLGVQEQIDAYDLIKSGFCNNIDDATELFWIVKNAGGMEDEDLARFIQRIRTTHAVEVDSEAGGDVDAKTVDIPTEARNAILDRLRNDIYEDMMLLDMKSLSGAQKTAQELQTAYQAQDNKTDDLEYFVLDFLQKILVLADINDEQITLTRSKVVNEPEMTAMVMSCTQYVSAECIIKHLPWLSSDEQLEEIEKYNDESFERFNNTNIIEEVEE